MKSEKTWVMIRVRANSEYLRTIFERICIELCHFMRNSHNASMDELENGFRLPKCCPCEARLGHLEIDTHRCLVTIWGVYLIIFEYKWHAWQCWTHFFYLIIINFTLFLIKNYWFSYRSRSKVCYIQTEFRRPFVVDALIFQEFNFNFTLQ